MAQIDGVFLVTTSQQIPSSSPLLLLPRTSSPTNSISSSHLHSAVHHHHHHHLHHQPVRNFTSSPNLVPILHSCQFPDTILQHLVLHYNAFSCLHAHTLSKVCIFLHWFCCLGAQLCCLGIGAVIARILDSMAVAMTMFAASTSTLKTTTAASASVGAAPHETEHLKMLSPGMSCSVRQRCQGRRRRKMSIVAASPPRNDGAVSGGKPLSKQDLVAYLASGCKPKEKWRIGTEHEKFGFQLDNLQPMTYEHIRQLLEGLAERFEWQRVMEGDKIIGLTLDGQSVSLEPGGQFELSGAPLETLHQTCAEVNSHLYQVKAVAEELGLGFAGIGFQPKWSVAETPTMPKGRYEIMRNYMPKVGAYGLDMMFRTCTVQVNLDFESEEDMVKKFRVGLALQPIATALFANSPFTEGKPNGFLSFRSHIWTDVDNNRSGDLPFVFEDGFGFEKYVDYALNVPMYFVYRNNQYVDCSGLSFKDFLAGELPVLPGETPTLSDWENHLTTIFPEVRLKRYLEMRGADGGPWRRLCALPSFWTGLLYDEESLQGALDITSDWTERERAMLRSKVPKQGLNVPFRDGLLKHVAQDIFKLAKDGLTRRGLNEVGFLKDIQETVTTGVTPAERLLELYHGKWGERVDPVFESLLY